MLALILALTVAQPFGVIASREKAAPRPPPDAENGDSVHFARVFGIPALPFRLYSRPNLLQAENAPWATLRARSWLWLPALTNASRIAETCSSDVLTPCWKPERGWGRGQTDLTVFQDGGKQWATIDNPLGRGSGPAPIPDSFTWKLRAGIASPAGLVYWILAAILVITARRRRARPSSSDSAGMAPEPSARGH